MKEDAWRPPGCDLSLLKTKDLRHLGLDNCRNVTDGCLLKMLNRCDGGCWSKDLSGCNKEANEAGVSALNHVCRKRQSINLECCDKVVDRGIVSSGYGYGQLQSISLVGCYEVKDSGVIALSHECGQLQSINLEDCRKVTDADVIALSAGCGQLQTINLS